MTILLVAFIFQLAVSATEALANQVSLPKTLSDQDLPERAATLVITKTGIVVEGQPILAVANGQVDCGEHEGGCQGIKLPKLTSYLATFHQAEVASASKKPGYDPAKAPPAELMIVADRTTPYHLLIEVMFSAKQKEAGYKHFRLIVQKSFPPHAAK
jgi:biopolymer transport protein ExbD